MLKSKLVSFCPGLLLLVSLPFSISADIQFRVTKVQAWVKETNFKGECPHCFEFEAAITVNKAGTVKYSWIQSHNQVAAKVRTLTFIKKGTKIVKSTWTLGEMGRKYTNYWKKVQTIAPNSMQSNRANFNLECKFIPNNMASIELFPYSVSGEIRADSDKRFHGFHRPEIPSVVKGKKIIIHLDKRDPETGICCTRLESQEKTFGSLGKVDYKLKIRLPGEYYLVVEPAEPPSGSEDPNILCLPKHTFQIDISSDRKVYVKNCVFMFYKPHDGCSGNWIP
jgi:hypothetical protein